jgi:hypothetical protein
MCEKTRSDPRTPEVCLMPGAAGAELRDLLPHLPESLRRKHNLTTEEASCVLDELGVPAAPATLRKWRCTGGGPPYFKAGVTVRYPRPELFAWGFARRGALRRSTREAPGHG